MTQSTERVSFEKKLNNYSGYILRIFINIKQTYWLLNSLKHFS